MYVFTHEMLGILTYIKEEKEQHKYCIHSAIPPVFWRPSINRSANPFIRAVEALRCASKNRVLPADPPQSDFFLVIV